MESVLCRSYVDVLFCKISLIHNMLSSCLSFIVTAGKSVLYMFLSAKIPRYTRVYCIWKCFLCVHVKLRVEMRSDGGYTIRTMA